MNTPFVVVAAAAALFAAIVPLRAVAADDDVAAKIAAALPSEACAKPAKARKVLVFSRTLGYRHESIPVGIQALTALGRKTGAFEVVASEDLAMFEKEKLSEFDAVLMLSTTGEVFRAGPEPGKNADTPKAAKVIDEREARLHANFLEFVRNGKGLIGIHAATDCCYQWPEYGEMIGGYFNEHPWTAENEVTVKVDEPQHPLCKMFESRAFKITDEIYQFKDPYSRAHERVLLSLDTAQTDMTKPNIKRTDGDFGVSWLRTEGRGRVFYSSLGHRSDIYWNPTILRHYLAGIQYALGDLDADATPKPTAAAGEWRPLFNGHDLSGWKGLVGDPYKRATMSPAELAAAQKAADDVMRAHWSVQDGVLHFDGAKEGSHLCTFPEFGDLELKLEWRIEGGGDSGIYLRGCPQVQIWDVKEHPEGSGGLYNNEKAPKNPTVAADRPPGAWNSFHVTMRGDRVTVRLNDKLVVDDVQLENYWKRGEPIPQRGQLELQSHMSPLWFRNIQVRELPAGGNAAADGKSDDAAKSPAASPIH